MHLSNGRVLAARAAVYTPSNRSPVVPAWAQQLGAAGQAGGDGAPPAAVVAVAAQLPAGIATADAVDLRAADLAGKRVVVVGGGMAAGLLAAGAAERGAYVTLVCRR